jgi:hypothetical protein
MRKGYVYKVLLFLDIFLCALIFRDPDCTLSAETGRAMRKATPPRWAKLLNGFLNLFEKDHCSLAVADDIARAHAAITYLETPP